MDDKPRIITVGHTGNGSEIKNWINFVASRCEKHLYHVELEDGNQFGPCWPNAGIFHLTSGEEETFPFEDVIRVKKASFKEVMENLAEGAEFLDVNREIDLEKMSAETIWGSRYDWRKPKSGCKHCYGRGHEGYIPDTDEKVRCRCTIKKPDEDQAHEIAILSNEKVRRALDGKRQFDDSPQSI